MDEKTLKCFISYSHKDKRMCNKFLIHFENLSRLVDTEHWYDGMIPPGGNIDEEIKKQLEIADVVFLLISPSYISSFYCYEKELTRAIERSNMGECIVIPVVLRDFTRGDYLFSKLKYVPTDGKPVDQFKTQNDGFVDAFTGIKNLLSEFNKQHFPVPASATKYTASKDINKGTNKSAIKSTSKRIAKNAVPNQSSKPIESKYKIVKNGKIVNVTLVPDIFSEVVACSHKLAHFSTDANTLMVESIEQFKAASSKTPPPLKNQLYRRKMESFLFDICGYIQHHFTGYDNTCIHIRVRDGDVYKDYFEGGVGYRKTGLSLEPIQAQNGMIECAIKNKMPVIKEYNRTIHLKSHPNEKISRNYITFAFGDMFNIHNINLSMCISVVGMTSPETNNLFTAMSITRFDLLIEKYLLQYISYCSKIDNKYNIGMIFKPEV